MSITKGNGHISRKDAPAVDQPKHTTDFTAGSPQSKAESSLLERLALRGHFVHIGTQNDFTVCKYGYAQHCSDAVELHSFAVRLGVIHA